MSTSRKVWLWVAVLLNLVGLQNTLAPATSSTPFGVLSGAGLELLRFAGILQISIALLAFTALKVTSADGRRAIDLFMLVGYGLGAVLSVYEVIAVGATPLMYMQMVAAGALACAFGYYLFSGPSAEAGQRPMKSATDRTAIR
jgi:xanthine/uracil permease